MSSPKISFDSMEEINRERELRREAEVRAANLEQKLNHLQAMHAQYRRYVETSSEGILEVDKDGRMRFCNARMAAMLGYSVSELLGVRSRDLVHPDEDQKAAARWER